MPTNKKTLISSLLLFLLFVPVVLADWAYAFVVLDGKTYVMTTEEVDRATLGLQLGEVTHYSDREGTYSGNFSNTFPIGTAYFSIIGMSPDNEIAVRTPEDIYLRAVYNGEYTTQETLNGQSLVWTLGGAVLVLAVILVMRFKKKGDKV